MSDVVSKITGSKGDHVLPRVIVLLSTYNGERWLEELLSSVVAQTGVDVSMLVRDDGSTDSTCDILSSWQDQGKLKWYRGDNIGWAASFMHLLCHAPAHYDYYAFADQDDIWMADKLKTAVKRLEADGDSMKLYCGNLYHYREGAMPRLVYESQPMVTVPTAMVKCITAGCTMVMDSRLRETITRRQPDHVIAHDFWVYQTAVCLGSVCYDPQPHLLYRQHASNQIGDKRSFKEIWQRRLHRLLHRETIGERSDMARRLLDSYADLMTPDTKADVERAAYYKQSWASRWQLFTDSRYDMGHWENNLWLKLRILLGQF